MFVKNKWILLNRFHWSEETWSYTNISSSQASESRFGDSLYVSEGEEETDKKRKDAENSDKSGAGIDREPGVEHSNAKVVYTLNS